MDKKIYGIGILIVTAVILLIANCLPQPAAHAAESVKDTLSEYQMVTARNIDGGDSLYIINRDGKMAIFQYDPTARALKLVANRAVSDLLSAR